jgi:cell division protein FtsB
MRRVRANSTPWWRRALRSRAVLAINLVLVGFVGWSLAGEIAQGNRVTSDLNDLQAKIAGLQKQNQDYGDVFSKLDSPGFVDKEARLKLGYQKPGEQVLLLKDGVTAPLSAVSDDNGGSGAANPQKWWHYFFGGN